MRKVHRVTSAEDKEITHLYTEKRMSCYQIAAQTGIPRTTVTWHIKNKKHTRSRHEATLLRSTHHYSPERVAEIKRAIVKLRPTMSLGQIAQKLFIPKSTVGYFSNDMPTFCTHPFIMRVNGNECVCLICKQNVESAKGGNDATLGSSSQEFCRTGDTKETQVAT